jgi:hypothetical protein
MTRRTEFSVRSVSYSSRPKVVSIVQSLGADKYLLSVAQSLQYGSIHECIYHGRADGQAVKHVKFEDMQQERVVVLHRKAGPHHGLFNAFLDPQAFVVAAEATGGRDGTTMRS